jgi:hypothetical protein
MRGPAGLGHQAHSQRAPAPGRGKVERMVKTIRRRFLVEVTGDGDPARHHVTSLDEINQLLDHWCTRPATSRCTPRPGQTPRQRWEAAPADLQAVGRLREALAWTVPATGPPTTLTELVLSFRWWRGAGKACW